MARLKSAALVLLSLAISAGVARSSHQTDTIPTDGPVISVVQTQAGSFVETKRGTYRLETGECPKGLCLTPDVIRGLPSRSPETGLPDGFEATSSSGDIRKAWFERPTDRYQHCVLGDCIEGGSLVVQLADGSQIELALPDDQVFEDITPRIFDFGHDGRNEVVAIRASRSGGAAVAVYGYQNGVLVERAQSAENGRPNRWLNIAGIEHDKIHFIRTPHIGGRLYTLERQADGAWREEDLSRLGRFSNHAIGSRALGLSYLGPLPPNERFDLVIPVQSRDALYFINRARTVALPGEISTSIVRLGSFLVTATTDGQLVVIKPQFE